MAPRALCYTRVGAKRFVKASEPGVTRADVAQRPPAADCGCLGAKVSASPATHERVPLSPLDTFLFIRPLQPCVAFFYAERIDAEALAASLSRTLRRYPLLAGASACARYVLRSRGADGGAAHRAPAPGRKARRFSGRECAV